MEVLVSNGLIVTICSTVLVTVIVMMDVSVGDSVVSVAYNVLMHVVVNGNEACDVLMNVVVSGTEASGTDEELTHINTDDSMVSMKGSDVIMTLQSLFV